MTPTQIFSNDRLQFSTWSNKVRIQCFTMRQWWKVLLRSALKAARRKRSFLSKNTRLSIKLRRWERLTDLFFLVALRFQPRTFRCLISRELECTPATFSEISDVSKKFSWRFFFLIYTIFHNDTNSDTMLMWYYRIHVLITSLSTSPYCLATC